MGLQSQCPLFEFLDKLFLFPKDCECRKGIELAGTGCHWGHEAIGYVEIEGGKSCLIQTSPRETYINS